MSSKSSKSPEKMSSKSSKSTEKMSSKSSKSSKKNQPTPKSKKAPKPKLTCQCCQKSAKDGMPCLSTRSAEAFHCQQCNREVCPRCLKNNQCYICRLKGNGNTNSEAALKKLKRDSLKTILKKLGLKGEAFRGVNEEKMIREIVRRCDLDGSARASQPSTSFKQDEDVPQTTRPSEVSNVNDPHSAPSMKEANKDTSKNETSAHKKTTDEFPLLENIQNEDQIRKMSIRQIRNFLIYYRKYDESMNEKREFEEVAIQLWRTEKKIPINDDHNRKQAEQQQHQEQVVEIHGNQEASEYDESLSGVKKRESFTLPAEGQGGIPMMGETNQSTEESTIFVKPLELINGEEEIQAWSTKQLKAFLEKYGRYNTTWLEKSTLQYEAIKIWRTEMKKAQQRNAGKEGHISNGLPAPTKSSEVQPKISITALPHPKQESSDESEEDDLDDQSELPTLTTFQTIHMDQEVIHKENLDARPKVVLVEIPHQIEHQNETKVNAHETPEDGHFKLQGNLSLQMDDFQDYDNMEAFMGQNGGRPIGVNEIYIGNHTSRDLSEMASESLETSDSFVYMQPNKEVDYIYEKVHRPESLPLKIPTFKKVGFNPVPEQISDSEDDSYSQARENIEDAAAGSSIDVFSEPSNFETPMSPEEFFDTLRDMENNMEDSSEFPDFTQAVRKRLSSDKSVEYPAEGASWNDHDDANQDGMHTPEEFLGAVYSIQANLKGDMHDDLSVNRDADIHNIVEKLAEVAYAEEATGMSQGAYKEFGIDKFKEAEAESGQSTDLKESKAIDIPLIENSNEQVTKILKTKAQRPESWGVSMDEILAEENIKKMKKHHLQLLLHKHGVNSDSLDKPEMIQKVTKLWLTDKENRISMYEEAISEGESSDESEGKISPDTEFEVCSLPLLPSPPTTDPQIIHFTMKNDFPVEQDHNHDVEFQHIKNLSGDSQKVTPLIEEKQNDALSPIHSENLPKIPPPIPKKPPVPPSPVRSSSLGRPSSNSAYLTFVMSEEEIEYFEEYKLRHILRTAKVSLKDIWKREDLVEEVIKVWKQEQLDRGRSLERSYSNTTFGLSRRSSTESLQQEVDLDNIQSEKDLEILTSRNLQNYLVRNGVPIQGLLLREHFLREAIKHWKSFSAKNVNKLQPANAYDQEPELLLHHTLSEKTRKDINKEDWAEEAPSTSKTDGRVHEESKVHLNDKANDTKEVDVRNEIHKEETQTATQIEVHGPAKPKRVSKIETLEDIKTSETIQKMEIKQIKALLSKYSVSFADCQERHEIVQRLETLWHDQKKREAEQLHPDELCKICMSQRIDCVLLDCGHVTTCTDCGHKIAECPICRNYVTKVVRLYKS